MATPFAHRYTVSAPVAAWRWWLGLVVILAAWFVLGSVVSLVLLPFSGVDAEALFIDGDVFGAFPSWGFLLFALVGFIPLLVATLLAYRFLLGQPTKRLFAAGVPFRMWRVWWGAFVWLLVMGTPSLIAVAMDPAAYTGSFSWQSFLPYALIALALLPVQTTAEEVFFRGWLLQWFGQRLGGIWTLSILSGVMFSLPHLLNPEAVDALLPAFFGYGVIGFALGWVTVRDRSLEIAIGAHAANNLFAALVVGYEGGALPAEAFFVAESVDWSSGNLFTIVLVPLFIVLSRWGKAPKRAIELSVQPQLS